MEVGYVELAQVMLALLAMAVAVPGCVYLPPDPVDNHISPSILCRFLGEKWPRKARSDTISLHVYSNSSS